MEARIRRSWIHKVMPGASTLRGYKRSRLKPDLVAGAALSAALVPAGMAYAEASGLPAVNGLYATVAPMIFYALFGPSRVVIVGPDAALAPMIAAAILPLAGRDPEQAVAMAGVLAILIGVFLMAGRVFKLGFDGLAVPAHSRWLPERHCVGRHSQSASAVAGDR